MSLSRVREKRKRSEREGFEPSRGSSPLLAFQASTFNRSATSPLPARALVAILLGALLVAASSREPAQRQVLAGHFNVAHPHAPGGVASPGANVIINPGFESGNVDGGWYQCGDVDAYTTTEHPHSGRYDEYSGSRTGKGEPQGNSGVCQEITILPGAILTAYLFQLSDESDTTFAYQEADLLDGRGNVVVNLFRTVNNRPRWVMGKWNLGAYSGRTYWLYFGVHGDGYPNLATQQFLDDVALIGSSPAPSALPRPSVTPSRN
jgi:hypothetical protein